VIGFGESRFRLLQVEGPVFNAKIASIAENGPSTEPVPWNGRLKIAEALKDRKTLAPRKMEMRATTAIA
jgi:hypothetical protein